MSSLRSSLAQSEALRHKSEREAQAKLVDVREAQLKGKEIEYRLVDAEKEVGQRAPGVNLCHSVLTVRRLEITDCAPSRPTL